MPKPSELNLNVKGAFKHSELCAQSQIMAKVVKLIQKDRDMHHIFFNDEGFHNHLVHQLLADYSLGANVARLEKSFKDNAAYQRLKRPEKSDFIWNSLNCLGNEDYYSSYVNFFEQEIQLKGPKETIQNFIFEEPELNGYSRLMSGVYHPLIHLGYGLEFSYPLMLAEGLAWTAAHKPRFPEFYKSINLEKENTAIFLTASELIYKVHEDERIDGIIRIDDANKIETTLAKIPDLLMEYSRLWNVADSLDGATGLRARATELQILGASLHASSYRPDTKPILDFFLMHTLTSSLFLHTYIEFLKPVYAADLLRGKFISDLIYYIARGRPKLDIEQFKSYPKILPWEQIRLKALASEDEHVPKAVRALIHAFNSDVNSFFSEKIYQAMASLTVDEKLIWNNE